MDPETNNYQGIGSILRIDLITSHSVEGTKNRKTSRMNYIRAPLRLTVHI